MRATISSSRSGFGEHHWTSSTNMPTSMAPGTLSTMRRMRSISACSPHEAILPIHA